MVLPIPQRSISTQSSTSFHKSKTHSNPTTTPTPSGGGASNIHRTSSTTGPRITSSSTTGKEPLHLPLYRRLLFPYEAPGTPVPKIIQGEGENIDEINEKVYHLIALALRAFVQSWYTRISPRDRSLIPQINTSIIHPILSPILNRINEDPDQLVEYILLDLPIILSLHWELYWESRASLQLNPPTGEGINTTTALGERYHSRLPLLSVEIVKPRIETLADPTRQEPPIGSYTLSPLYLTSLTDSLLRQTLPQEDYTSPSERLIIREILGRSILSNISRRLIEPWFYWQIGLKLLGEPGQPNLQPKPPLIPPNQANQLENIIEKTMKYCMRIWMIVTLVWNLATTVLALLSASPKAKNKYYRCWEPWLVFSRGFLGVDGKSGMGVRRWDRRLVWGGVEMVFMIFGPVLDRLLPHLLDTLVLTRGTSLKIIDLIQKILFPLDGYPGPTPVDPTLEEAADLRIDFERRLSEVIPHPVQYLFIPSRKDYATLLDPIGDSSCNAHIVALILDGLVATLIPELVVGGVRRDEIGEGREEEMELDD